VREKLTVVGQPREPLRARNRRGREREKERERERESLKKRKVCKLDIAESGLRRMKNGYIETIKLLD
jgi:hypothetical protein